MKNIFKSNNDNIISHLSIKDEQDFNIIYMSDRINDRLSLGYPYHFSDIRSFKEFKLQFNLSDIIIVDIKDQEYFDRVILYIKNNKFKQKIIATINKGDKNKVYSCVESKITDFLFNPVNLNELYKKINSYYRDENFIKSIYKMKTMEIEEITDQRMSFYNKDLYFSNLELKEEVVKFINNQTGTNKPKAIDIIKFKKLEFDSICINTMNNYNINEDMKIILKEYLESLTSHNYNERNIYIDSFSKLILYGMKEDRPEETVLKEITSSIISEFKEIYDKEFWVDDYLEKLTLIFELELRTIGLNLKYRIQDMFRNKQKEIQKNSLHLLMSSSSDRLNNLLGQIEIKYKRMNDYFVNVDWSAEKKDKSLSLIKKNLELNPVNDFKEFLQKQSRLFSAFKDEDNTKYSMEDLEFLFSFLFKNGIKVKYSNIEIDIINKSKNSLESFYINENVLIDAIYVLIENAIEANATNIELIIKENDGELNLYVKNNGFEIEENCIPYLFDKFYTNKENKYGIGLAIAKNILAGHKYTINYIKEELAFLIKIGKRNR